MEYEIKDDPQGQPDRPDGDRDGGLVEDPVALRKSVRIDGQRQLGDMDHASPAPTQQN